MPTEDEMTIDERLKRLGVVRQRHVDADRNRNGVLLSEMQSVNRTAF